MIFKGIARLKTLPEMFPQTSHPEYENLKKNIIRIYQNSTLDIEKVKDCFQYVIDSRRSLSKVKNLNDIFKLLEMRDVLNHNQIAALECIESVCKNKEVSNLINGYKKLYIESDSNVCSCGQDLSLSIPINNPEPENTRQEADSLSALETAFDNIAKNIGKNWRVLASELMVPERYVDEIRDKYPSDMYQQTLKILQIWKNYNGESATLELLKRALDSRLCKQKGVGSHMLKPVIVLE